MTVPDGVVVQTVVVVTGAVVGTVSPVVVVLDEFEAPSTWRRSSARSSSRASWSPGLALTATKPTRTADVPPDADEDGLGQSADAGEATVTLLGGAGVRAHHALSPYIFAERPKGPAQRV